jgi:hypothetical protein
LCPRCRSNCSSPVSTFHTLTLPSLLPATTRSPSGLKSTEWTAFVRIRNFNFGRSDATSQTDMLHFLFTV